MMFFAGALQFILVMGLWLLELAGRAGRWPTQSLAVAPTWAHKYLMLFGVFPFLISGFQLTVYPRWMGGPTVPASRYVAAFGFLAAGMILFYAGLFASRVVVAAHPARALVCSAWDSPHRTH
jgi:uncharacterized protein involved in response to NO